MVGQNKLESLQFAIFFRLFYGKGLVYKFIANICISQLFFEVRVFVHGKPTKPSIIVWLSLLPNIGIPFWCPNTRVRNLLYPGNIRHTMHKSLVTLVTTTVHISCHNKVRLKALF